MGGIWLSDNHEWIAAQEQMRKGKGKSDGKGEKMTDKAWMSARA